MAMSLASSVSLTCSPLPGWRMNQPASMKPSIAPSRTLPTSELSPFCHSLRDLRIQKNKLPARRIINAATSSASALGDSSYFEEPATKVKFQTSLCSAGCTNSLSLIGTGFREKVFAIIGVKVYAVGLYINKSILGSLSQWKGQSESEIQGSSSLFTSILEDPNEKMIQIIFVRDVDGKTFWDALDEAIVPRVKAPDSADSSALSTFRSIFQGREFKKGSSIFLTWVDSSKMLVSISSDGTPHAVDATIDSRNVSSALYDVYLGEAPVSPSLKSAVASGLASLMT